MRLVLHMCTVHLIKPPLFESAGKGQCINTLYEYLYIGELACEYVYHLRYL